MTYIAQRYSYDHYEFTDIICVSKDIQKIYKHIADDKNLKDQEVLLVADQDRIEDNEGNGRGFILIEEWEEL